MIIVILFYMGLFSFIFGKYNIQHFIKKRNMVTFVNLKFIHIIPEHFYTR